MPSLVIRAGGLPAPQGSKRHVGNGVMVESSKRVKPWRAAVRRAARQAIEASEGFVPFDGPVQVDVTFYLPRPRSHYGTGRNAEVLKPNAPTFVTTLPDIEKLVRSTHDALTAAQVWSDDSRVVDLRTTKRYCRPGNQGALIEVTDLSTTPPLNLAL